MDAMKKHLFVRLACAFVVMIGFGSTQFKRRQRNNPLCERTTRRGRRTVTKHCRCPLIKRRHPARG